MVKILVENDALVNQLHYSENRFMISDEKSGYYTPLLLAVFFNNVEIIKYLVENGADPNIHYEVQFICFCSSSIFFTLGHGKLLSLSLIDFAKECKSLRVYNYLRNNGFDDVLKSKTTQ